MCEEFQQEVLSFIESPEQFYFDQIYYKVWQFCEASSKPEIKQNIQDLINIIIEHMHQVGHDKESDIMKIEEKINYFCLSIENLASLFQFFDSSVEENEKIFNLAITSVQSKYFAHESTILLLQKSVNDEACSFLRSNAPFSSSISRISLFLHTISPDLYNRIINGSLTTEFNMFFSTLPFSSMDPITLLTTMHNMYKELSSGVSEIFMPSSVNAFRDLFCTRVISPEIPRLLSKDLFYSIYGEPQLLAQLYVIVTMGTSDWIPKLANVFIDVIKKKLEEHSDTDFVDFVDFVASEYEKSQQINTNCFDQNFFGHIKSLFLRYLDEHSFSQKLCSHIDRFPKPIESLSTISLFLMDDAEFENNYCNLLTNRLFAGSNVNDEAELIRFFDSIGLHIERASNMIKDFSSASIYEKQTDGTITRFMLLNRYYWHSMRSITFKPPELFQRLFDETVIPNELHEQRKLVFIADSQSTVEFSNGSTHFELPLFHSFIVQLLVSKGPLTESSLCSELAVKPVDLSYALRYLKETGIITIENDEFIFVGPPVRETTESVLSSENNLVGFEVYSNCNDQIDAAIMRFLKNAKVASTKEIMEFVYTTVPSRFPVTDEKIEQCLLKLSDRELIMRHGGRVDSYRYIRH